jgi:hypothetical protein
MTDPAIPNIFNVEPLEDVTLTSNTFTIEGGDDLDMNISIAANILTLVPPKDEEDNDIPQDFRYRVVMTSATGELYTQSCSKSDWDNDRCPLLTGITGEFETIYAPAFPYPDATYSIVTFNFSKPITLKGTIKDPGGPDERFVPKLSLKGTQVKEEFMAHLSDVEEVNLPRIVSTIGDPEEFIISNGELISIVAITTTLRLDLAEGVSSFTLLDGDNTISPVVREVWVYEDNIKIIEVAQANANILFFKNASSWHFYNYKSGTSGTI